MTHTRGRDHRTTFHRSEFYKRRIHALAVHSFFLFRARGAHDVASVSPEQHEAAAVIAAGSVTAATRSSVGLHDHV